VGKEVVKIISWEKGRGIFIRWEEGQKYSNYQVGTGGTVQ
jgi:hypothetical protein